MLANTGVVYLVFLFCAFWYEYTVGKLKFLSITVFFTYRSILSLPCTRSMRKCSGAIKVVLVYAM